MSLVQDASLTSEGEMMQFSRATVKGCYSRGYFTCVEDAVLTSAGDAKITGGKVAEATDIQELDDEATTDAGHSDTSESESSSGLSGNEAGRLCMKRRSRFAKISLETIPATPSGAGSCRHSKEGSICRFGTTSFNTVPKTPANGAASPQASPPGLSRAAMRQARDAHQPITGPTRADVGDCTSNALCRFGMTTFDTVPKTPAGAAKLKALKEKIGSPPGLSRTDMRKERDTCNAEALKPSSWSSCQVSSAKAATIAGSMLQPPARSAKAVISMIKQDAARLKQLKAQKDSDNSEEDVDAGPDSGSEQDGAAELLSTTKSKQCRFEGRSLGTVPSTPAGGQITLGSPPGLSRAAMRQARDTCKSAAASVGGWQSCTGEVLTISPAGHPTAMAPPAR